MEGLEGRVALVSGAAGVLGGAVALGFHAAGACLVLLDRGSGRLARLFPTWAASDQVLMVDSTDLTRLEQVEAAVGRGLERFGHIDVAVNAAGGYRSSGPLHLTDPGEWDFMMDLNARSALHVCRAVLPSMLARRAGRIVNVASVAALRGSAQHAAYSASKSAVVRLTESLADEVRGQGIGVNCVLPSTLDTPSNRVAMPGVSRADWLAPAAVAQVILFLCGDRASAVHGAAIPLQGRG
jgi:NAD(P)-dependent dehydrogenase (short-subunit alcohol dehydrogenase family)